MNMDKVQFDWSPDIWDAIHQAVYKESQRTEIASKFLPLQGPMPEALTVPSDTPLVRDPGNFLVVDESAIVPLIEIWVEFILTPQQVEREMDLHTARTLAIRAANFLSRGQDTLIFQGQRAVSQDPLFTSKRVRWRSGPAGNGLFNAELPPDQTIVVRSLDKDKPVFRERTLQALTEGISILESKGMYGPFAMVLASQPYGDAHGTLPDTLITAAERIATKTGDGFYGTGTLPTSREATGLILSLGGNSMDLVIGYEDAASWLQKDDAGMYRFRVAKRFALRLKEKSAVIRLIFKTG